MMKSKSSVLAMLTVLFVFSVAQASSVPYGVGMYIQQSSEVQGAPILVGKVLKDSPAERAGILPGDQIVAIDGEQTAGMDLSEVTKRICGVANSKIELTIVRSGTAAFTISLARDFKIPTKQSD